MIGPISNSVPKTVEKVQSVEKVILPQRDQEPIKHQEPKKEIKESELSKEKLEEVVNGINEFMRPINTSIKFVLHEKLNDYYVTIIDDTSNEVVREIPSKKLLDTYANMMEFVGILVDKKI